MNKKILFLILAAVIISPLTVYATKTPTEMATAVKDLAVAIGGAVVVIGWVVAGILYLTAAGAPEKVKTAKGAMIAAIIGTVLVILASAGYDALKTFLEPIIGS